jgi:hypothetical protein
MSHFKPQDVQESWEMMAGIHGTFPSVRLTIFEKTYVKSMLVTLEKFGTS